MKHYTLLQTSASYRHACDKTDCMEHTNKQLDQGSNLQRAQVHGTDRRTEAMVHVEDPKEWVVECHRK